MKKFSKILLTLFVIGLAITGISHTQAANPDAFVVDIQPSSFEPNTPIDMTIKSVKGDGTVVKEYVGDVYIDVIGSLDPSEYVVPSDHLYTFTPQDQGIKLFSKGLIIKKPGTYVIQVSDIVNDSIKGEQTVIVGTVAKTNLKTVNIDSPIASGTEKNEMVNVFGTSPGLPNSPFQIWLNSAIAGQGTTDANGGFNGYISGVILGANVLQVKILDISSIVIGESESIGFNYVPIADGVYNSIQVLPGTKITQGAKVTFVVSTNDSVTSAVLKLSNGKSAPMDKDSPGVFKKEILIDTAGSIDVSVDLLVGGQTKSYTGVTTITSEKGSSIGKVRLFGDPLIKDKLNVTWETIGDAAQFKVLYGTGEGTLFQSVTVNTNEISIENLLTGVTYFFKIIPLDTNGVEHGSASDVVQGKAGEGGGGVPCIVKGITISDMTIGDKHFLTWSGVLNVTKYLIYRSDFETTDVSTMSKIAEVTDTRFEYPFNKNAKKEKFAYYLVEAVCTDGNGVIMDNVKKVNTGPVENILLFLVISLLIYTGYRLYQSAHE